MSATEVRPLLACLLVLLEPPLPPRLPAATRPGSYANSAPSWPRSSPACEECIKFASSLPGRGKERRCGMGQRWERKPVLSNQTAAENLVTACTSAG
jgi:hypothetical protein